MSTNDKRVIIVDDEPAARAQLRDAIEPFSELSLIAELDDGLSAIEAIHKYQPDIVFLDIDMPGLDGFAVAKATEDVNYQLVFVTAHHQYALQAFGTHAIDYVTKPVRPSAVAECVRKILRQESLAYESLTPQKSMSQSLVLTDSGVSRVIDHSHILYVEGLGRYRRIHLSVEGSIVHRQETIISDTTLDEFTHQLEAFSFVRVHRSYLVNLRKVIELRVQDRRHFVSLQDARVTLPVARNNVNSLKDAMIIR